MRCPATEAASRGDAFHHVAVAAEGPDVVIEELEPGTVEVRGQPALGDGHADAVGDSLAQRAGRCLDARRQAVFGMAGSLAAELAEILDVVERDGGCGKRLCHPR